MGHDLEINSESMYVSYNHAWYFYHYLDEKYGIKYLYYKKGRDVLPFLLYMRSALEGSPAWYGVTKDTWQTKIGNIRIILNELIRLSKTNPNDKWWGD